MELLRCDAKAELSMSNDSSLAGLDLSYLAALEHVKCSWQATLTCISLTGESILGVEYVTYKYFEVLSPPDGRVVFSEAIWPNL